MDSKRLKPRANRTATALGAARRDAVLLGVLLLAVLVLVWNGSTLFQRIIFLNRSIAPEVRVATVAMTLNLALILFGWRRYVDIQHAAEIQATNEARAAALATTDMITGLYNRKGFAETAGEMLAESGAGFGEMAIFSFQLSRFKAINDRHGYDIGDGVLRRLADDITACLPDGSVIARLSGDEFAAALPIADMGRARAEELANTLLREVTKPFEHETRLVQVGAYLGVSSSRDPHVLIPDLLRRADIAMDRARTMRSARAVWFDQGMEREMVAQGELEQSLRFALEHDEFIPFFEPQIDLSSGELVGFEVLARWNHPSGIIGPDRFIPVAEELGLIGRLSDQVFRKAFTAAAAWDNRLTLSVNISPVQLTDSWLAQKIVRLLTETQFPADRLVIEITESSLFADIELARSISASLKNQGIRLALDDFGTGFSSLAHLRELPFDVIKIDRTFVGSISRDRESAAIVRAVSTLANAISIPVTVEGIEDAATHVAVLGMGCQVGQGWLFGKPMDADRAAEMIRDRRGRDDDSGTLAASA